MRAQKVQVLLAGTAVLALALSGCSSSSNGGKSSNGKPSGQLIFGEPTEFPENLMPLISAGNSTAAANIEVRLQDRALSASAPTSHISLIQIRAPLRRRW